MSELAEIDAKKLLFNPFTMIENDWFLITAEKDHQVNTMTAASGALGHMFRRNVAYINIRPTRYTKEFVDAAAAFTLSFFDPGYKKALGYLGRVSGRQEDKIAKSGLILEHDKDGVPYFSQAHTIFFCRKIYRQLYDSSCFLDKSVENEYYPERDYHDLYICDIYKTLSRIANQ
jgi:flavin reductase (DIM6/NTAB) family NADH-FMN oxidoreductase RutF